MDDSHRRFLQALMRIGIIDEPSVKQLYLLYCTTYNTNATSTFDDYIATINSNLEPMFIQIRKGMCEDSGRQYYALVSMVETDITRMASDYADPELEVFRKIMDLVVESETGSVYSTEILNLTSTVTKKSKKRETEQLLNRFVSDNWLIECQGCKNKKKLLQGNKSAQGALSLLNKNGINYLKRGEYCLSTRFIIEMAQYIRIMYQDQVKDCHICRNIVFQSQICDNPSCGIKMHLPCVARFFRGTTEPHCPACKDIWPHEIPEIEEHLSESSK